MKRTWTLAALTVLAALGFAVSAYAKPHQQRWRWPVITTRTSTTVPTTTATDATPTTTTTTTLVAAAGLTTTATPPPADRWVKIAAPPIASIYTRGSTVVLLGRVKSDLGPVTCTFDYGDGTVPPPPVLANEISPGLWECAVGKVWMNFGRFTIKLVATAPDYTIVGTDSIYVDVY
jgi:hypothetical protein